MLIAVSSFPAFSLSGFMKYPGYAAFSFSLWYALCPDRAYFSHWQKQFTIIFEEMLDIIPNLEYNILDKILRGANMKYMSASEAAAKWGVSSRRVGILCNEGRIDGAQKAGATWIIPEEAGKPSDARIKSGKYIKLKKKVD